jgi:sugar/nucleoside kinase (ribokinase family)
LVIGSTVVDVLLSLPSIPVKGDDVNISAIEYKIGGCAYNVFKTLKLAGSQALLCSPCGQGIYGRMVREHLKSEGLIPFVDLDEENGCCYCLVEDDGERSFLSYHGAEYRFSRSWMNKVNYSECSGIFVCGLEIEEPSGSEIIDFVYEHPELELYFAPGPRIKHIQEEKIERLLARRDNKNSGPLFHLNETEAEKYTGKHTFQDAAKFLFDKTGNSVVITLGARGCYCMGKALLKGCLIPGYPAKVLDTVGAGDAHCGALIACLKKGMNLEDACNFSNKMGAEVTGIRGAVLEKLPDFAQLTDI